MEADRAAIMTAWNADTRELIAAREEIARLAATIQQTEGVHHSWVWEEQKQRARVAQLEAALRHIEWGREESYMGRTYFACPHCRVESGTKHHVDCLVGSALAGGAK